MPLDLAAELRALELRLLQPEVRRDRSAVASLLAPDFVEFGSSGRIFTREQILDLLEHEEPARLEMTGFAARMVSAEVALVLYQSTRPDGPLEPGATFLRSSLWVRCAGRWQMIFHQGTRIPAPPA